MIEERGAVLAPLFWRDLMKDRFPFRSYVLFTLALIAVMRLCICVGSVSVPLEKTVTVLWNTLWGLPMPEGDVEIMSRGGWAEVTAVKTGMVLNADADAFSRPGPRLKDAAVSLYNFINGIEEVPDAA